MVEHLLHGGSHGGGALDGQTHHAVLFGLDGVDLDRCRAAAQQHPGHDGDAEARLHHGDVGLVVDDVAAALGGDGVFLEELAHLSVGGVALDDKTLAVHQLRRHNAVWRFGPVLRHDAEQRLTEQLGQVELFAAAGGQEGQVHLTGAQPLLHVVVSTLIDLDFDLGVACHEALEDLGQQAGADRVECTQLHLALFQAVEAGDALLQGLVAVEHRPDGRVERSAIAGHGHAVFAAVE